MPFYKKEIYSGDVYEAEVYFSLREKGKRIPRGKNEHLSSAQQQEMNERNAIKKISRLVNTNFKSKDLFITLTYRNEISLEDAEKEIRKFIRKIREYRKKHNLSPLKYIAVTETENGDGDKAKIHHHIVMSVMSLDVVNSKWKNGRMIPSELDSDTDYAGLAQYITKTKKKEHKKRWSQSRNLDKPIEKIKILKRENRLLKPPKGYKTIQQQYYASEVTGKMQYVRAIRIGGIDYAEGNVKRNE